MYDSPRISKTAAKAQARRESHMYRQGAGYVVSVWDDFYGCRTTSEGFSYQAARHALAAWRRGRALLLVGGEARS